MRILSALAGLVFASILSPQSYNYAHAACGPNALGTSRTIVIDAAKHRSIRGKEASLGLRHKEVILTFDDGPIAGKTPRILKALQKECVKATFFYVGKMARAYPKLVRRVVAQGHTLAHHTHNHNRLPQYSTPKASALIDQGVSRLQKIAYGDASTKPRTPFFRYPYLARNKRTDRLLAKKGLIAFGANIDALDWKRSSPSKVHDRIMRRLRKEGKGIILMHDIQARTAKMLPRLLRTLKAEGYRVVHMVPKGTKVPEQDPILVASLDTGSAKPLDSKIQNDLEADLRELAKIADEGIDVNSGSRRLLPKNELVRVGASSADEQSISSVSRTGIKIGNGNKSARTPAEVARLFNAQLKIGQHRTSPSSKVASQTKQRLVSVAPKKKVQPKRVTLKRSSKKKFVVLAGNRKRKTVNTGRWKLRRSQWILR